MSDAELLATGIISQSTIDRYHLVDRVLDTALIVVAIVVIVYVVYNRFIRRTRGKR